MNKLFNYIIGDFCWTTLSTATSTTGNAIFTCAITAASTAVVDLHNETGGSIDYAIGTLSAAVIQF